MAYIGREPQIENYQICDAISVVNGQALRDITSGLDTVEKVNAKEFPTKPGA